MVSLPEDLRRSLDQALGSTPAREIARAVERLIECYRSESSVADPIVRSAVDATAYAAYRMPATYAAVRAGLGHFVALAPDFRPRTHLDVGGGTGAAVWAAADTWPSLESAEILERSKPMIALGRQLAEAAESTAVRRARWSRFVLSAAPTLPHADLVTMSYVLGELAETTRAGIVRKMAAVGGVVALFEPGTPAGYERIIAARDLLIELGMTVVAPCPHDRACPIVRGEDWCHFAVRLNRSALHRRVKAASRGYEDEKFSYAIAAPPGWPHAANRVVRHPLRRKGLVVLRLCAAGGELRTETVSKRLANAYRQARDVKWGDAWPPVEEDS